MKVSTILTLGLVGGVSAFAPGSLHQRTTTTTSLLLAVSLDRRNFFEATTSAILVVAGSTVLPAFALEDLAEPTEEEKEAAAKAAQAERVRRKLELQKQKAAESNTFSGSLKGELKKQKDLNSKTKEERRNALCEELGRGC